MKGSGVATAVAIFVFIAVIGIAVIGGIFDGFSIWDGGVIGLAISASSWRSALDLGDRPPLTRLAGRARSASSRLTSVGVDPSPSRSPTIAACGGSR